MSDSDIEIKKIPPMKPVKKPPTSPTVDILKNHERKATTRTMIHQALEDLKTRKGVSSYAIKKYLEEKYEVKTDKMKYLIKKTLKAGVEDGSIIQVKGIGASGSFKLASVKEKPKKPKIKKDKSKETGKEKPKKEKMEKSDKLKEKAKKVKMAEKKEKITKSEKAVKKASKETEKTLKTAKKGSKEVKDKIKEKIKDKIKEKIKGKAKAIATPSKKKANMMKRKSIGSIIKKPKMKPKIKA